MSQKKDPKAEPRTDDDTAAPASRGTAGAVGGTGAPASNGAGATGGPGRYALGQPATRPGVATRAATSIKGRATLAFDGGIPVVDPLRPEGDAERPPIVVPSTTATTPKAVTQPPPWTDGAAHLAAGTFEKGASKDRPVRGKLASAEEISESMFLGEDAPAGEAEELSGSLLVEEATANAPLRVTRNVRSSAPTSRPPPAPPAHKPSRWSAAPSPPSYPPYARPKSTVPGPPPPSRSPASVPPRLPAAAMQRPLPKEASAHLPQLAKRQAPPSATVQPPTDAVQLPAPYAVQPPPEAVQPPPPDAVQLPEPVAARPPAPLERALPEPEPPAEPEGTAAAAVPAQGFARDDDQDRSTKPHVGLLAAEGVRAPSGSMRASTADDAPTSPVAVDTAPPTEDSLPRGLATPEPTPAARRAPIAWKPALEKVRAAGVRAQAWVRAQRPAIDAALQERSRWFLPAVALAGLLIGVGLVAWIASATRHRSDAQTVAMDPATASVEPAATETAPSSAADPLPAPVAPPAACTVAGERHVLAPKALVSAGVELRAVGDSVAVGFAPNEHLGTVERLDADTLAVGAIANARSKASVRRVNPVASNKNGLGAAVDADRPQDALRGRRTVSTDPALQLGVADGALQWAKTNGPPAGKLWDLDGDGDVDALRAATDNASSDKTFGVVFRHANAVNIGLASGGGTPTAQGPLTRFTGTGTAIGSPTIALQDGIVFAAWADRATADDPWRVRWIRFKVGENPGEPTAFSPPAGGPGEQTMSPAVVAVPGKRFLLVWTEGPQARHDVRALTFGEDGAPIGSPLVISSEGANAGQAQIALTASGRGAIAFLESTQDGFQVAATPVTCAQP